MSIVNVWRHFCCHHLGWICYWRVVGGGLRCCKTSYNAQNSPIQQRVIQPPKVNGAKGGKPWFKLIEGKLNIEQGISGLAEGFILINWNDFSYH